MKREEAIVILQEKHDECKTFYDLAAHPEDAYPGAKEYMEALQIAIAVLRGPTREQVRMGMWIRELTPQKLSGRTISHCSKCWHCVFWPNEHTNFCPRCGRPMTDEAVDIVMKKLEELYGKAETD